MSGMRGPRVPAICVVLNSPSYPSRAVLRTHALCADPKTAPTLATRTDYLLVSVQRTTGDVVVTPTGRHLDATVVFESIRLVAVQRCVDSCGLGRRNRSKESHQFCERPSTASGATDVRQSVCKRNAVERSGLHLWVISRR